MSAPSCWVPAAIYRQADALLAKRSDGGGSLREAVELVLKNDSGVSADEAKPTSGLVDAGALLKRGLANLTNNPHDALGIPLGAQTMDVKKAFRKMALKYHPDKNPKTTPLFQAISLAQEKLSDSTGRRKEEEKAQEASNHAGPHKPGSGAEAQANRERERERAKHAYHQQQQQQHQKQPGPGPGPGYGAGASTSNNPYPSGFARAQAEFAERQKQKARQHANQQQQPSQQSQSTQQQRSEGPAGGTGPGFPGYVPQFPKSKAEADYNRAANAHNQRQKNEPFSFPRPNASPDEEVERDARAFRERREAAKRAEAEAKSKNHAYNRESKARTDKEEKEEAEQTAEAARRHREEVLQQGQKAYNDEVKRRRAAAEEAQKKAEEETDRHRRAAAQAAEARAKQASAAATPTPDTRAQQQAQMQAQAKQRADAEAERVLRGYRGVNRSSAGRAAYAAGVSAATGYAAQAQPGNVGTTFTANAYGQTAASATPKSVPYTGAAAYMRQERRGLVPSRPFGLQTVAVGATQVELKWQVKALPGDSKMPKCEFQWRLVSAAPAGVHGNDSSGMAMGNWQTANKLVELQSVRKKNLISGALYEFRVRALSSASIVNAGGMSVSGECSEWCDSLKVRLKSDTFKPQGKPLPASAAASGANSSRSDVGQPSTIRHDIGQTSGPSRASGGPMSYRGPVNDDEEDPYAGLTADPTYANGRAEAPRSHQSAASKPAKPPRAGGEAKKGIHELEQDFALSDGDEEEVEDNLQPMPRSPKHLHRTPSRAWGDASSSASSASGTSKSNIFDKTHYHKVYDHNASFGVENAQEVDSEGSSSDEETAEVDEELNRTGKMSSSVKRGKLAKKPQAEAESNDWNEKDELMFDLWAPPDAEGATVSGGASLYERYEHPVYELPDKTSKTVGTLIPGMCVQARPPRNVRAGGGLGAENGTNWIFCRFHKTAAIASPEKLGGKGFGGVTKNGTTISSSGARVSNGAASTSAANGAEWGWAIIRENGHTFLARAATAGYDDDEEDEAAGGMGDYNDSQWDEDEETWDAKVGPSDGTDNSSGNTGNENDAYYNQNDGVDGYRYEEEECEVWVEHTDEQGNNYYVNEQSGESSWDPPEWVQELDPTTGINYYVHHIRNPKTDGDSANAQTTSSDGNTTESSYVEKRSSSMQRGTYGGAGISLHSTWSKPEHFAQLKRHNASTAAREEPVNAGDSYDMNNEFDAADADYKASSTAEDPGDEPVYDYQEWEADGDEY